MPIPHGILPLSLPSCMGDQMHGSPTHHHLGFYCVMVFSRAGPTLGGARMYDAPRLTDSTALRFVATLAGRSPCPGAAAMSPKPPVADIPPKLGDASSSEPSAASL
eukprot:NODE_2852_length_531_cov_110.168050_g2463_i0.p1 GENE.NODE_2852_length_531_cov_110.168050_g2463_i0~~NODE_2852_length_531_cov_110.168050_g2463_i0.p1  ORF type:complete len:106 (+),score=7.26 NODE_2852_length_531_cov_110.168050_g2463_i0:133-450(+)